MPYFAVIGRIPYDDEDSCYTFNCETRAEACKLFVQEIYADSSLTEEDMNRTIQSEGSAAYIIHVLKSESEIEEAN